MLSQTQQEETGASEKAEYTARQVSFGAHFLEASKNSPEYCKLFIIFLNLYPHLVLPKLHEPGLDYGNLILGYSQQLCVQWCSQSLPGSYDYLPCKHS